MSLVNHKSLILSFNWKKPGKNSKHRVHVGAYTLVQTIQCLQFTINRFHSKASPQSLECLITFVFWASGQQEYWSAAKDDSLQSW